MHRALIIAAGALLLGGGAAAQERAPLVSDRPDFTESTETVAVGLGQIEGGYTLIRSGGADEHAIGEVLLRLGVASGVELRVGLNSLLVARSPGEPTRSGLEGASLGAKLRLAERPSGVRPAAALLVDLALPTGTGPFRRSGTDPAATLAAAWALGERTGLAANAGLAWTRDGAGRFAEGTASLSLARELTRRVAGYVEAYGFAPSGGRDGSAFLNGGVTVRLSPDLQLDARAGTRLRGAGEHLLGIGVAHRW